MRLYLTAVQKASHTGPGLSHARTHAHAHTRLCWALFPAEVAYSTLLHWAAYTVWTLQCHSASCSDTRLLSCRSLIHKSDTGLAQEPGHTSSRRQEVIATNTERSDHVWVYGHESDLNTVQVKHSALCFKERLVSPLPSWWKQMLSPSWWMEFSSSHPETEPG